MVSRVRVWLNRTYAENVFFMDQLRRNPSDRAVEIHATHGDADSPVLAAADTADLEPEGLSPAGYVEYALDQCVRRGIDVFVPRLHQSAIVAHRADFEAAGTALLAPPPEAVAVFHDKVIAYEAVQAIGVPVPPWWRVRSADELARGRRGVGGRRAQGVLQARVRRGRGGIPGRSRAPPSRSRSSTASRARTSRSTWCWRRCEQADEPVDWLVMPRLEQPEVSVDCLTGPDNRIRLAVGRTKNGRRRGFTLPSSGWSRRGGSRRASGCTTCPTSSSGCSATRPVLMDVNTRPAGGLHQLSLCGVNAPWAAVQLALGEDPGEMAPPFLGQDYTVVSGPRPLRAVSIPQQSLPPAVERAPMRARLRSTRPSGRRRRAPCLSRP